MYFHHKETTMHTIHFYEPADNGDDVTWNSDGNDDE
jgi:hypothetical protein